MKQWIRSWLARWARVLATPLLALAALAGMAPAASASLAATSRPRTQTAPAVPASLRTAIHKSLGPGAYSRQTRLAAADGAPNDEFGYSVALSASGHTALAGAIGRNSYAGAAFVFTGRGHCSCR
jgi:FG-GAP repeat protein